MKVMIVDDSRLARQELRHLIKDLNTVAIVGEAANAEEAKVKVEELKPDLLLLDIQMPGKDGFELLEDLDAAPEVIFTTAYNEYALKAFEYNALDYLQKPVKRERLVAALEKVGEKLGGSEESVSGELLSEESQVFVKDGERCWFVRLGDVRLFESEGNYARIHFEDATPMVSRSLNYLEERLDPKVFFRANRKEIINLKWIDKIEPWFSGGIKVFLKEGGEVEVSRRQAVKFKELMSF